MLKDFWIFCFCFCFISCTSTPKPPEWIKNPRPSPSQNNTLTIIGKVSNPSNISPKNLQLEAEKKGKKILKKFIYSTYTSILNSFRIQVGELHDSKAIQDLLTNPFLYKKTATESADMFICKQKFYDSEKKIMYCLLHLKKNIILFKFREKLVEQIQNSSKISLISKEKAQNSLDILLKKEEKRLYRKFEQWIHQKG